jgi:transmembrane sensor
MPTTRLADLFQKYFDKTATPEERAEFMRLTASDENAMELRSLMEQAWTGSGQPDPLSAGAGQERPIFDTNQSRSMLRNVLEQAKSQEQPLVASRTQAGPSSIGRSRGLSPRPAPSAAEGLPQAMPVRRIHWARTAAAAIILTLFLGSLNLWQRHPTAKSKIAQVKPETPGPAAITPGGNKATLILDDGSTVTLDSLRTGTLATQGNTRIVQLASGRLSYNSATTGNGVAASNSAPTRTTATAVLYNTVRTPKGGQYQVTLPDGSKVWLNAATSLRFPTAFTGRDRTVELTGEAYFEIARNKDQPFRVNVNEMTVNVLGTHFNIMAYENEGSVNTSLLQGSVRVEQAGQAKTLQPGQESRLNIATRQLLVAAADTDQAVAWKNGLFQFDGATLETVMHQVERWYDVEVRYEGEVTRHFSGQIPRSASLPQVLHMLELAGKTRFILEGRTVVVKPY